MSNAGMDTGKSESLAVGQTLPEGQLNTTSGAENSQQAMIEKIQSDMNRAARLKPWVRYNTEQLMLAASLYIDNTDNVFIRELSRRAKASACDDSNPNCLVFDEQNNLNIDRSSYVFDQICKGAPQDEFLGNLVIYKLYERPGREVELDPIEQKALSINGADKYGITWNKLSKEARQAIMLGIERGHIPQPNDHKARLSIYQISMNGLDSIFMYYQDLKRDFLEANRRNRLPETTGIPIKNSSRDSLIKDVGEDLFRSTRR